MEGILSKKAVKYIHSIVQTLEKYYQQKIMEVQKRK